MNFLALFQAFVFGSPALESVSPKPCRYPYLGMPGLQPVRLFSANHRVRRLTCDAAVLALRGFLRPKRGSPMSAQGKRPTGASPWVRIADEFEALKGNAVKYLFWKE